KAAAAWMRCRRSALRGGRGSNWRRRSLRASEEMVWRDIVQVPVLIPTGLQSDEQLCGYNAWYAWGHDALDNLESSVDHSPGWPTHSRSRGVACADGRETSAPRAPQ